MPHNLTVTRNLATTELPVTSHRSRPGIVLEGLAVGGKESIVRDKIGQLPRFVKRKPRTDGVAQVGKLRPCGEGTVRFPLNLLLIDQTRRRHQTHVIKHGYGLAPVHLGSLGVYDLE